MGDSSGLDQHQYYLYINKTFLMTALPLAAVTFILTGLLKTKTKEDALMRSSVWTIMVALYYIITGVATHNFIVFFGDRGVYALLLCTFTGPVLYALINRLEGQLIY
jgi:predicted Co/Zn/Cd cation transporter (cation efflux family)